MDYYQESKNSVWKGDKRRQSIWVSRRYEGYLASQSLQPIRKCERGELGMSALLSTDSIGPVISENLVKNLKFL